MEKGGNHGPVRSRPPEREATESLMEEDTAKEILGWIFEAAVTFLSVFVITAALLAFFGILDIHII